MQRIQSKPEVDKAPTAPTVEALNEVTPIITKGFNMSNSTVVTTNPAIAAPDLTVVDGQITTTSNQIAEHFGKRHDVVLRAVRNLECSENFRLHNFAESSYTNEQGKKMPCYRITRDGFVFLAMGFTGKEAAQWKEAYITAFNKMEAELNKPVHDPERIALAESLAAEAVAQVYRTVFGAVMEGGHWYKHDRYLLSLSYDQTNKPSIPRAKALGFGKMVVSMDELPDWINGPDPVSCTDLQLARLAMACAQKQEFRAERRAERENSPKQIGQPVKELAA